MMQEFIGIAATSGRCRPISAGASPARRVLRNVLGAGAILALLSGAASAQMIPGINLGNSSPQLTPEELEKQKRIEDEYNRTMEKIPEKKAADPWGVVRQNPSSASKAKQGQK